MNAPISFVWSSQTPAATKLAYAVASWDECVSLVGEDADTAVVLDQAERELSRQGIRCVHVCGLPSDGGLTLRGLMAQVTGRAASGILSDGDLEAGFMALTEPGHGYSRVVLLVAKAHGLLPSAMRYIQFACRSSPKLLVVLAGQSSLATALADDEFAYLRHRITRKLELPGPAANDLLQPFSTASEPSPLDPPPVAAPRRMDGSGTLVRVGLAASIALAVWTTRWNGTPAPSTTAMQPDAPVSRRTVAVARTETQAPIGGVLSAGLEADKPVASQVGQRLADAVLPMVADMPGPAGHAVPEQDPALSGVAVDVPAPHPPASHTELAGDHEAAPAAPSAAAVPEQPANSAQRTEHAAVQAPEQAAAVLADPSPEQAASPMAPDTFAELPAPEPQDQPVEPAQPIEHPPEQAVAAAGTPPEEPASPSEQDTAPPVAALGAEHVAPRMPEPLVAQVPELPLPPRPLASVPPPPFRLQAVATLPPPGASEKTRRPRRTAELNTAPVEVPPTRSVDEVRCRDIVFKAQLGESPSDADKRFMRGGCRAR